MDGAQGLSPRIFGTSVGGLTAVRSSRECQMLMVPSIALYHSTRGFHRSILTRQKGALATQMKIKVNPGSSTNANMTIAQRQQLYMMDETSPGSIFMLPNGTKLMNKLVKFMKLQQGKQGFQEVMTPLIYKKKLWETSGHWENYKEDMFRVEGNELAPDEVTEDDSYGLKPMNCPGHCIIYKKFDHSYKDLPIRYSDYSSLHRNEASGALSGLTRVRRFHQDDGHIFCTADQIKGEIETTLKLVKSSYTIFKFVEYELHLSTRPENYIGSLADWSEAELNLKQVLDESGHTWHLKEGDGAFYGPKIDVSLKDNFGKRHQVATIQLDFQLPNRFELKYRDAQGSLQRPIMIHRAIYGSLERFLSLLIDHYQGKWPFWLNPKQCIVIPVTKDHVLRAEELQKLISGDTDPLETPPRLTSYRFDVDVDSRDETVGYRIKDAIARGYSYISLIGDREVEHGTLSVRSRDSRNTKAMQLEEVIEMFQKLEDNFE